MAQYASRTTVNPADSRKAIEKVLSRYGATQFGYLSEQDRAGIFFTMRGRNIRMMVEYPSIDSLRYVGGRRRTASAVSAAREQAIRQRWRALLLLITAKLEAIESGITTFEAEMLSNTLLPDGSTVAEWMEPQVAQAYSTGAMPAALMLPAPRTPATRTTIRITPDEGDE